MKRINPRWVKLLQDLVNSSPYFDLQQMIVKNITYGGSELEIDLQRRHMQPFGVVHGGVFASLIDAAGFWAVFSKADESVGMTTVELKLNFLAPAKTGKLIGVGRCIKLGRTLGLGESQIFSDKGDILAHGTTTVMIQRSMALPEPVRKISKFA